jgi:hypothetical protein
MPIPARVGHDGGIERGTGGERQTALLGNLGKGWQAEQSQQAHHPRGFVKTYFDRGFHIFVNLLKVKQVLDHNYTLGISIAVTGQAANWENFWKWLRGIPGGG